MTYSVYFFKNDNPVMVKVVPDVTIYADNMKLKVAESNETF